jgi:hypothetical protein
MLRLTALAASIPAGFMTPTGGLSPHPCEAGLSVCFRSSA